jgi:hypothetical protein
MPQSGLRPVATVTDAATGRSVLGAQVLVTTDGTTHATIYAPADTGLAAPIANPLTVDSAGNYTYRVSPPGEYDELIGGEHFPVDITSDGEPFVFTQVSPSTTWTVPHGLGRSPAAVTVRLPSGEQVLADVVDVDSNTIAVRWATPSTGTVEVL